MIEYKTDSVYVEKIKIDSVHIKVKEYINGDTFVRDSIVYRCIFSTDTIYIHDIDSVPYPVPVVEYVDRMNDHQRTMYWLGWLAVLIVGLRLFWKAYKKFQVVKKYFTTDKT